jgi:hypothetical protein
MLLDMDDSELVVDGIATVVDGINTPVYKFRG